MTPIRTHATPLVIRALALAFAAGASSSVLAGDRYFVGPDVGVWNTPDNWSLTLNGPPGAPVPVNGDNVFVFRPTISNVQVDRLYTVPGLGNLSVDGTVGGNAVTLTQSLFDMYVENVLTVGINGEALYAQSGREAFFGAISLGDLATGVGSYRLEPGAFLTVGGAGTREFDVGRRGIGNVHQLGGTLRTQGTSDVVIGNQFGAVGTYHLDDGLILLSGGTGIVVGMGGNGEFMQAGGTINGGSISVAAQSTGRGVYIMNGGLIQVGTINIGGVGRGDFRLQAGTIVCTTTVALAANGAGSIALLDVTGGSISAPILTVGSLGFATLNISNATVTAESTLIGTSSIGLNGTVNIRAGGVLRFLDNNLVDHRGLITIAEGGVLELASGLTGPGTVRFDGAAELTGGTISTGIRSAANATITKTQATPLTVNAAQQYAVGSVFRNIEGTTTFLAPMGDPANPNLTIVANGTLVRLAFQAPHSVIGYAAGVLVGPQGRVVIEPGSNRALVSRRLEIDTANGGRFDVTNNTLVLQHLDNDHGAAQTLRLSSLVFAGRNGGGWSGTGILSTYPPQNPHHSVGVFNNDDTQLGGNGNPILPSFRGVPLDARSIVVAYTLEGDGNMDSRVDSADLVLWIQGFTSGGSRRGWFFGDYDHNATIDLDDLLLLAGTYYSINGNVNELLTAVETSMLTPAQKSAAIRVIRSVVPCPADFDDGSGQGHPDGGVTIEDLLYYLSLYASGSLRADLDDGSGTGVPDGGVTIDDLLYFLTRYQDGC